MLNFKFRLPTEIIFGKGEEKNIGLYAKSLGEKILIHYGEGSVVKSGLLDTVCACLDSAGIKYLLLGGAKPNPMLSLVYEGIKLCKENGVTGILAVGGGSAIDSAKAIADGACYDGDVWDFFDGKADPCAALPVGVILTLAAAGSESSVGTVITNDANLKKRGRNSDFHRPVFAICNPELTYGVSAYQTACGVSDINAHILERYFSNTPDVNVSDRLCEALLLSVIGAARTAIEKPSDYAARADIMWAGSLAHNNLVGVGREQDWASHALSHELSALYGTAHGAALAIIFPAWMKYVWKINKRIFLRFATVVMGMDAFFGEATAIVGGINKYEDFLRSLGLPVRMSEIGIPESAVEQMALRVLERTPGSFKKLSYEDILNIYRLAY